MQLITDGPDIPDALWVEHEKGNVVFFCGAGISVGAGLPLFGELTQHVIEETGGDWKQYKKNSFEEVLEIHQRNVIGDRSAVLTEIWKKLQPNYSSQLSTKFHEALITLSRTKSVPRHSRLVTTNFDRIFEECLVNRTDRPEALIAPRPPIPKDHYWNGIVYLHGLLPPEIYDDNSIDNLILTSSDFGRAYLSERWAARFVTEMFRNYVVCFIGYSLNDPVMRYMIDAISADTRDGVPMPARYIFTDDKAGWDERGVKPIVYKKKGNHHLLRETIVAWAKNYSIAIDARKEIVAEVASKKFTPAIQGERYRDKEPTGRLMWALQDAKAAEFFSKMEPPPSWEWIHVLDAREYTYDDLASFGHETKPLNESGRNATFSLLEPKIKFEDVGNWNLIANTYPRFTIPDTISARYFHDWIMRHLEKPEVAVFLAKKRAPLNPSFKSKLQQSLSILYENGDLDTSFQKLKKRPVMQQIWELFLWDRIRLHDSPDDTYLKLDYILSRLKVNGLTPINRIELLKFFEPKLTFFESKVSPPNIDDVTFVSEYFRLNIDIASNCWVTGLKQHVISIDSIDEKSRFLKLFIEALEQFFEFRDTLCKSEHYFGLSKLEEILEESSLPFAPSMRWLHLADAAIKLLSTSLDNGEISAKQIIFHCLQSSYNFLNFIGLHFSRNPNVSINEIFEFLVANKGTLLTNYHLNSQLTHLLEHRAQEFTPNQILSIEHILLGSDDGEEITYEK